MADSVDQKVREAIQTQGYGVFLVTLKPEYSFGLWNDAVLVEQEGGRDRLEERRDKLEDRIISGIYSRTGQLASEHFVLDIFAHKSVFIRYQCIHSCEKIRNLH